MPALDAAKTLVARNAVAPMIPPPSIDAVTRPAMVARFRLPFMSLFSSVS